ncbi:MAG: RES family NAD+ phosphorylase [Phycisphaerae bacterium]|nr:RES family NAD+ phosphorylase [Saprospiraceae bacterium]
MNAFRMAQNQYAKDLSGKGAELFGGRWNSIGIPLLYSSLYRSLCILEHLVHLPEGAFLGGYSLITIELPDSSTIQEITFADLPNGWKNNPISPTTRRLGNKFVDDYQHLALKVPSVLVPEEHNLLQSTPP